MTLAGTRALVMGGSSGIGAATARGFAAAGAEVVVNGRDAAKAAAVAGELGGRGRAAVGDASSAEEVARVIAEAGAIDHLVLALSGASGGGPFAGLALDELAGAFEAKFWGHLRVLQAALPALTERGSVTFVSAGSARAALPGTAGLAAINGALEAMVGPLAAELAPRRVNAVSPGVVRTPWWDGMPPEQRDALFAGFAAGLPVGRIGEPEDVAQAILLCAANGYLTGSVIDVAGGGQLAVGPSL